MGLVAEIKYRYCNQLEAEALAEVFGSKARAEEVANHGKQKYQVVAHLSLGECHAALRAADLIIDSTCRLDIDEPEGSGQYYTVNVDGFDTHIIGIPSIEQAALRMAA